jgi:hypothetical protein
MTQSAVEEWLAPLFQLSFEQKTGHMPLCSGKTQSGPMTLSAIEQLSFPMPHRGFASASARKPQSAAGQR